MFRFDTQAYWVGAELFSFTAVFWKFTTSCQDKKLLRNCLKNVLTTQHSNHNSKSLDFSSCIPSTKISEHNKDEDRRCEARNLSHSKRQICKELSENKLK